MTSITFLLSSAGRRVGLLQALRHGASAAGATARIVATDRSRLTAAGHLADVLHLVPSVADDDFIPAMAELIEGEGVDAVVPTIDTELPILAAARPHLEEAGARVLVSEPEVIATCADKALSSAWLQKHGVPVPTQYHPEEAAELPADSWPLFYKPRAGSSSVGATAVHSPAELAVAESTWGPGVVEELIVGDEYTADCWVAADGALRCVVPRKRLAVRGGEIAKGVTCRDDEIEEAIAKAIATLPGLRGPVTIQLFAAEDGPRFIEINPRFGGGYPLSHRAGAWYTAALTAEVLGSPVDDQWFAWEDDLLMLRYDDAVYLPATTDTT